MINVNRKSTESENKPASPASLQLLPLIMNNIPQAVFWKDHNLVYLGCNRAFAEDAGLSSPEEVIGKTDFDLPWKAQAELYRADDRRVLDTGESKLNYEEPQTTPDGSTIWLRTSKIPVRENDQVIAILGMYEDITAYKKAHEASEVEKQRFHMILETVRVPTIISRLSDGIVLYANQAIADISQVHLEKLVGFKTGNFYVNPDDRKTVVTALQQQGHIEDFELQFQRTDKSTYWALLSSRIIDYEGEKCVLSTYVDITTRKQAETDLLLRDRALASSLSGVVISSLDGKPIYVNDAFLKLLGYTREEGLHHDPTTTILPEDYQAIAASVQSQGFFSGELSAKRRDGSIFPAFVSVSMITDSEGKPIAVQTSFSDITARKQAEADLLLRDRALASSSSAVIIVGLDFKPIYVNDAFLKLTGYTREEALQLAVPDITGHPDGVKRIDQAMATQGFFSGEEPVKRKDGSIFPSTFSTSFITDDQGKPVAIQSSFLDISENKRAEQAITESEERFRRFTEATNEGLVFHEQGKIVDANPAALAMFGLTEASGFIGRNLLEFVLPEFRQLIVEKMQLEDVPPYEVHCTRADGSIFPVETSTRTYQIGDRTIRATSIRDITERRLLEAQIREAYERRGLQVRLSTQISQSIAVATNLEELYERVVKQVKEQFGYYHTQLLRYDPAQDAVVLVTGYGDIGAQMLASGHRMAMGEGLIGTAASGGETILRPSLENDPDWHPNPLLPATKGEIAVPIKLGDTILGVLDVQSSVAGALGTDDQLLLEGLCGQIATAIESTRLRQEMAERLEEVNRLYRAMSREGWKSYLGSAEVAAGFMYDQKGLRPVTDPSLAGELFANIPLTVPGGEVIGTLAVAEDPQRIISPEDETFLQQVSEQVALALESARLFGQTQEALNWQQAINHTSILIGQARGVEEITRAAAELLPLLGMTSCAINIIKETNANGAPTLSDLYVVRHIDNEFVVVPPVPNMPTAGWLPDDVAYYQKNRVTIFPKLDDITTMTPKDAYPAPGAVAYMLKAGMHSAVALALGVQNRPIGYLTFTSRSSLAHVPENYITWLATVVDLISTAIDSQLLLNETERGRQTLARRASELETVATVSTTASSMLDPDQLLQSVVDLARERFGLYHAHIYTYEEAWNTLMLAAGAGEVGRKLVAEEHAIPLSTEQSLVARAARDRRVVIVNDVTSEPGFLANPLLPDTRAEMAVPMTAGDKLLGVFDVQSSNAAGFSSEDANIYVTLAAQVGVALQNARLYVEQAALVTQLRELDRLKSSFLANMSHELRTPLNSILGFADVIIEELDGPLTENMSNDLRLIQKNGQHLLHLINDVLDMAKIEAGRMNLNPERFVAFEVLEEVTSITSTLASEKNLALFLEEDSDQNIKIYADRTRLRQVMINLVNNAIKFTENGKISIKVAPLEGARILITVKDTGIGIPPDKLDAVFQEFTQVDSSSTRKAGGTGLGLPISRKLVEMHGGRLWAESTGNPGEGSTFFVELPVEARITETVEKQVK